MDLKTLLKCIQADCYRYSGKKGITCFLKNYFLIPGLKYTSWMRTTCFLAEKWWLLPLYVFCRINLKRLEYKFGICISYNTEIGHGLYIGHFGGIVVNYEAIIGKNCNINHGVTIGSTYGGKYPGTPKIGNNVYIGPGAFVIGGIDIGDNVAIGANTVVTKPVPENAVITSSQGEVISLKGSNAYIVNTDY